VRKVEQRLLGKVPEVGQLQGWKEGGEGGREDGRERPVAWHNVSGVVGMEGGRQGGREGRREGGRRTLLLDVVALG